MSQNKERGTIPKLSAELLAKGHKFVESLAGEGDSIRQLLTQVFVTAVE